MHSISQPQELESLIQHTGTESGLVVVKFFAPNCVSCKTLFPKVKRIASVNQDITFIKANALSPQMLPFCKASGMAKLPYFRIYHDAELVAEFVATLRKLPLLQSQIEEWKDAAAPAPVRQRRQVQHALS